MWAPWRIEYIVGPKNHDACIFCTYANGTEDTFREHLTVVSTEFCFGTLNRYPFASGHLMVMPKRHVAHLTDLPDEEYDALFRLVRDTSTRLKAAVRAEGLNVGINLGATAGAGLAEHLHVHVVPRWSGDTNFMPVLADVRVMPQYLDETWAHLYSFFLDIPGARAKSL